MNNMSAAMIRDYAIKMFAEGRLTTMQSAGLCGMNMFVFLGVAIMDLRVM